MSTSKSHVMMTSSSSLSDMMMMSGKDKDQNKNWNDLVSSGIVEFELVNNNNNNNNNNNYSNSKTDTKLVEEARDEEELTVQVTEDYSSRSSSSSSLIMDHRTTTTSSSSTSTELGDNDDDDDDDDDEGKAKVVVGLDKDDDDGVCGESTIGGGSQRQHSSYNSTKQLPNVVVNQQKQRQQQRQQRQRQNMIKTTKTKKMTTSGRLGRAVLKLALQNGTSSMHLLSSKSVLSLAGARARAQHGRTPSSSGSGDVGGGTTAAAAAAAAAAAVGNNVSISQPGITTPAEYELVVELGLKMMKRRINKLRKSLKIKSTKQKLHFKKCLATWLRRLAEAVDDDDDMNNNVHNTSGIHGGGAHGGGGSSSKHQPSTSTSIGRNVFDDITFLRDSLGGFVVSTSSSSSSMSPEANDDKSGSLVVALPAKSKKGETVTDTDSVTEDGGHEKEEEKEPITSVEDAHDQFLIGMMKTFQDVVYGSSNDVADNDEGNKTSPDTINQLDEEEEGGNEKAMIDESTASKAMSESLRMLLEIKPNPSKEVETPEKKNEIIDKPVVDGNTSTAKGLKDQHEKFEVALVETSATNLAMSMKIPTSKSCPASLRMLRSRSVESCDSGSQFTDVSTHDEDDDDDEDELTEFDEDGFIFTNVLEELNGIRDEFQSSLGFPPSINKKGGQKIQPSSGQSPPRNSVKGPTDTIAAEADPVQVLLESRDSNDVEHSSSVSKTTSWLSSFFFSSTHDDDGTAKIDNTAKKDIETGSSQSLVRVSTVKKDINGDDELLDALVELFSQDNSNDDSQNDDDSQDDHKMDDAPQQQQQTQPTTVNDSSRLHVLPAIVEEMTEEGVEVMDINNNENSVVVPSPIKILQDPNNEDEKIMNGKDTETDKSVLSELLCDDGNFPTAALPTSVNSTTTTPRSSIVGGGGGRRVSFDESSISVGPNKSSRSSSSRRQKNKTKSMGLIVVGKNNNKTKAKTKTQAASKTDTSVNSSSSSIDKTRNGVFRRKSSVSSSKNRLSKLSQRWTRKGRF